MRHLIIVALLGSTGVRADSPLRFKTGAIDPVAREARAVREASALELAARHLILQFAAPPGPEQFAELARRDVRALRPVPENAVLAVSNGPWRLDGLDLRWAGPLTAADKLSPALAADASSACIAAFHPDVDLAMAREVVASAGLLVLEHPDLLPGQVLAAGAGNRIRALAERDEVAYILPASLDLVMGNRLVACPGPLIEEQPVAEFVKVGRGWPAVNGEVELRYVVSGLTSRLPESTIRAEVARALEEWAKYGKVRLVPGAAAAVARTIAIRFARGAHGDPYNFDGPGRVLAHTFYPAPPNPEPIAGDIHLDDDEDWGSALDLYSVVLHETGHALGLGHSDQPGSVMYPYYRTATVLTNDDIEGIRELYGPQTETAVPATPPPVMPPATPPPYTPPSPTTPSGAPDRTSPSVRITAPAFTIVSTSRAAIAFRGTASDNVAVSEVRWSTSGGASGKAVGTTEWSAAEIPLLTGTNTVTVRAWDAAGNSSWRAVTVVRR